jgi:glycosyltransferase involved in cell wall biosynthesis
MQITVPNEFQPVGKYNIGCTAGIETTIAPAEWVEGCGRMNLILGSSEHTIKVLKESKFEKRDQKTNQVVGVVEWKGDNGEVIFEGANTDIYKPIKSTFDLSNVKEEFAYLFVGHWINGALGEDRKNVGLLIKAFYETFKNKSKKPALILKTSTVGSSYMDRDELIKRIQAIRVTVKSNNVPNVYLLHGEFTDEEMNQIYNHSKVKAMVSLTKGEGFGRPLLEFSLVNKPIITTNWSGHIDYLNSEFTTLLPGELTNVHESAANHMLMKEAQWFSVDTGHVGHYLKDVFENYKGYAENAKRQGFQSRNKFSFDAMKEKLDKLFTEKIPEFPKQVQMQLPKLQKLELPKLKKVEQ